MCGREQRAVERADLQLSNGELTVRTSRGGGAHMGYDGGGFGDAARPEVDADAEGWLVVDARALGGGQLDVDVPAGAPILVLQDRGEVDILLSAPADLDVCLGAGELSIGLPAGAYDFDIDLAFGGIDRGLVHDPASPFEVHACAVAGEIDIFASDALQDEEAVETLDSLHFFLRFARLEPAGRSLHLLRTFGSPLHSAPRPARPLMRAPLNCSPLKARRAFSTACE